MSTVAFMYHHCGAVENGDLLSSWWNGNVASVLDNRGWQYAQTGNTLIQHADLSFENVCEGCVCLNMACD